MLKKINALISTLDGPALASTILAMYGLALASVVVSGRVVI